PAPASERRLTAGAYLGGALELVLVVAALAFGARRVRALVLPGWSGAPARLAEIVFGVAALIWVSEALGTFGGFEEGVILAPMIVVGAGAGLVAGAIADGRPVRPAVSPPAPAPVRFFDRDIVSPMLNVGWLAVALLAAWCIGRPYGLGPQALVGGSIALGSQSLIEFQAGEALNDITGVTFTLAAIALLVNGY